MYAINLQKLKKLFDVSKTIDASKSVSKNILKNFQKMQKYLSRLYPVFAFLLRMSNREVFLFYLKIKKYKYSAKEQNIKKCLQIMESMIL